MTQPAFCLPEPQRVCCSIALHAAHAKCKKLWPTLQGLLLMPLLCLSALKASWKPIQVILAINSTTIMPIAHAPMTLRHRLALLGLLTVLIHFCRTVEACSSRASKALATRQIPAALGCMLTYAPLQLLSCISGHGKQQGIAGWCCTHAVDWRSKDCLWPNMQATMVVADRKESLTITGNGDVVEPHDGVVGEPSNACGLIDRTTQNHVALRRRGSVHQWHLTESEKRLRVQSSLDSASIWLDVSFSSR